jgi:hypothetical protein
MLNGAMNDAARIPTAIAAGAPFAAADLPPPVYDELGQLGTNLMHLS